MANRGYNSIHGFDTGPAPPDFDPAQPWGIPQYPGFAIPPTFGLPTLPLYPSMVAPPPYPGTGYGYPGQYPAPPPITDGTIPGIHLRNDTGGVGLPPGYNYAFPAEHCKIHVFKTPTPPWQATLLLTPTNHVKLFVPVNVTMKELMQGLGCKNEDPAKNKMYEICEAGNGKWLKGMCMSGDDKDRMKMLIKDCGWDKKRTGAPGGWPVVWVWCTKD
ncbi:hypothetical protein B7494_g6301 [Chlorociboria aeruginascens]|nr:hypothetical protein B7494_g6301 [Chlorociboria aeruginascens]